MLIKILKTEEEYQAALKRVDEIFFALPGTREGEELELLHLIIQKYEDEKYPLPSVDPIEAIEFVMDQKDMKPKDLVGIIGDKTLVSKVLNRKRKLTIEMIRNLHQSLQIPFELLFADYELARQFSL